MAKPETTAAGSKVPRQDLRRPWHFYFQDAMYNDLFQVKYWKIIETGILGLLDKAASALGKYARVPCNGGKGNSRKSGTVWF